MEAYFISDIHLKSVNERNGQVLLRFLHSLVPDAGPGLHLFLLGDIFDLWLSDHAIFIKKYYSIIEIFKELRQKGAKLYYFEGNHDLHLSPYWRDQLGFEVYDKAAYFELGGRTVRVEHGDEINQDDLAYLRLRKFVRSMPIEFLAHYLPGKFWEEVGKLASHTSRKYSTDYRERTGPLLQEMIRKHALRGFESKPFDLIVSGHMHIKDDYEFDRTGGIRVRSINLGSWFDESGPQAFYMNSEKMEWIKL